MNIKVRRKLGAQRINRFTTANLPSLEFPDNEDIFEIPIVLLLCLEEYFEPYFPVDEKEEAVKEFMLGGN